MSQELHQEWRTLLDARASAFDNPAAEKNAVRQMLVSVRKQNFDALEAAILSLFESLPTDVAIKESVTLVQRIIERATAVLRQTVRESHEAPEYQKAVIGYLGQDINIWKELIRNLERMDIGEDAALASGAQ